MLLGGRMIRRRKMRRLGLAQLLRERRRRRGRRHRKRKTRAAKNVVPCACCSPAAGCAAVECAAWP